MSSEGNEKLFLGFVEFLDMFVTMMKRIKEINQEFNFNAETLKAEDEAKRIFEAAHPLDLGLIFKVILKYSEVLNNPMANIDALTDDVINEIENTVNTIRKRVREEKNDKSSE